jgi:phosphonopyruvate decarboxylase
VSGAELAAALERHGFGFFTGVPCSLLEDLIAALERRPRAPWVPAVREDAAVGLAAGAWLGGRRAAVLMQNSGLGTSANALASLSLLYGLPALLVVTWRGFEGKDAPEHLLTGAITPGLLELHGIPYRVLGREGVDEPLAWAREEMDAREIPVALLVPPGVIERAPGAGAGTVGAGAARTAWTEGGPRERRGAPDVGFEREEDLRPAMSRREALAVALKQLGDEPVIHANGYIGRESCALADRPQSFYMIGSMGLAAALGLGLALVRPGRPSVVFDGDGNLLMNLGLVAMAASLRPERFVHVVFDNEVYGSTGGQRSPSREVRLDRIARAAGYRATAVAAPDALAAALRGALAEPGPHFVLAKVSAEGADAPRIPHAPRRLRDRFRASLGAA